MKDICQLFRQRERSRFCRECGEPDCVCYRESLREDSERELRQELRRETSAAFSEARTQAFLRRQREGK